MCKLSILMRSYVVLAAFVRFAIVLAHATVSHSIKLIFPHTTYYDFHNLANNNVCQLRNLYKYMAMQPILFKVTKYASFFVSIAGSKMLDI